MKEPSKILKMAVYLLALPLISTAVVMGEQLVQDNSIIEIAEPTEVATNLAPVQDLGVGNYTATINDDGEVIGRISSVNFKNSKGISDAAVYFMRNEQIVKSTITNDDGTFVVNGLEEGIYAFVGISEFCIAICGVDVVKANGGPEAYLQVSAITPNARQIRELVTNGLLEASTVDSFHSRGVIGDSIASGSQGVNRVQLQTDEINGKIVSLTEIPVEGTKVHLYRGDAKVSETVLPKDGTFKFESLESGVYDMVAVGEAGVVAVCFEARNGEIDEDAEPDAAYTALQDPLVAQDYTIALAPRFQQSVLNPPARQDDVGAVIFDSPAGFVGDQIAVGIPGGANGGFAGNLNGLGGLGGGGGRFGLFGGRRGLLLGAIAAGIAIPISVSPASASAPVPTP